jgi:hypothetical protein
MRFYLITNNGFSSGEMDWNANGKTSLFEYMQSSDIGKREVSLEGKICIEYYSYKDGLPIKTVCNNAE